ncbi:MAG: hypothetical protein NTY03_15525, partial [Candidatus Bathyarchaeota archaeon]|nr:hypothetical protein [Candidatus Bathyarchaeota archaeon]
EGAYVEYAKRWGVSVDVVKGSPMVLVGSSEEVKEKLYALREETGISYIVLGLPSRENIRLFGEGVVKDLTGK